MINMVILLSMINCSYILGRFKEIKPLHIDGEWKYMGIGGICPLWDQVFWSSKSTHNYHLNCPGKALKMIFTTSSSWRYNTNNMEINQMIIRNEILIYILQKCNKTLYMYVLYNLLYITHLLWITP